MSVYLGHQKMNPCNSLLLSCSSWNMSANQTEFVLQTACFNPYLHNVIIHQCCVKPNHCSVTSIHKPELVCKVNSALFLESILSSPLTLFPSLSFYSLYSRSFLQFSVNPSSFIYHPKLSFSFSLFTLLFITNAAGCFSRDNSFTVVRVFYGPHMTQKKTTWTTPPSFYLPI